MPTHMKTLEFQELEVSWTRSETNTQLWFHLLLMIYKIVELRILDLKQSLMLTSQSYRNSKRSSKVLRDLRKKKNRLTVFWRKGELKRFKNKLRQRSPNNKRHLTANPINHKSNLLTTRLLQLIMRTLLQFMEQLNRKTDLF